VETLHSQLQSSRGPRRTDDLEQRRQKSSPGSARESPYELCVIMHSHPPGEQKKKQPFRGYGTFQPLLIFGWFRDYKNLPVPLKINRFKSRASTTTSQTPPASKHYYNMPGASCCLSNVVKQAMQFVVGLLLLCFQMGACTRVLAHVHIHLHRLQACLLGDCLSLHTASDRYIHHALARSQQRYSWKACQGKQAQCWLYVICDASGHLRLMLLVVIAILYLVQTLGMVLLRFTILTKTASKDI